MTVYMLILENKVGKMAESFLWFMMSDHNRDSSTNKHSVPKQRSTWSKIWKYFNKSDWKSKKSKLAKCIVKGCQRKTFLCDSVGMTKVL